MNSQTNYSEIEIEQTIKDYILKEFMYNATDQFLSNEDSLVSNRILDSLKIVRLRVFLEEQFEVTIHPEEVLPENFENLNALKSFVFNKLT